MTTKKYFKKLKKALSSFDKKRVKEILLEIQNVIDENNLNYSQIQQKFGSPEELAQNYLEDKANELQPQTRKVLPIIKKVLVVIGIIFIVLASSMYYFFSKYSADKFDYSKHTSTSIDTLVDNWVEIENRIDLIKIQQTKTIIYWHNNNSISYSCKGEAPSIVSNILDINQAYCYLKLPATYINVDVNQSSITLINPQQKISIKLVQSELRMVEKQDKYNYQITKHQSEVEVFNSYDDGIVINLEMVQSALIPYKY